VVRLAILLGALASTAAVAADSVVLGHGVSNAFLSSLPCAGNSVCLDAQYVWVLDAGRTLSGPKVTGRVKAIATQHTEATARFVNSVELFILRPIKDASVRRSSRAAFYLVSLSPRDAQGRYCLSVNPSTVGLTLDPSEISVDGDSGSFCFSAAALASNNRRRGP
jgi:hypothetical protein